MYQDKIRSLWSSASFMTCEELGERMGELGRKYEFDIIGRSKIK
jgi:hypothetical protein